MNSPIRPFHPCHPSSRDSPVHREIEKKRRERIFDDIKKKKKNRKIRFHVRNCRTMNVYLKGERIEMCISM